MCYAPQDVRSAIPSIHDGGGAITKRGGRVWRTAPANRNPGKSRDVRGVDGDGETDAVAGLSNPNSGYSSDGRNQALRLKKSGCSALAVTSGRDFWTPAHGPQVESSSAWHFLVFLGKEPEMWIFTKCGFFSVVCAREGHGERGKPLDLGRVMIRARDFRHLEKLQEECVGLSDLPIERFPNTDYEYRIFATKDQWAAAVTHLAQEIDYGNFKSEISKQGRESAEYLDAMGDVWVRMAVMGD